MQANEDRNSFPLTVRSVCHEIKFRGDRKSNTEAVSSVGVSHTMALVYVYDPVTVAPDSASLGLRYKAISIFFLPSDLPARLKQLCILYNLYFSYKYPELKSMSCVYKISAIEIFSSHTHQD